MKKIIRLTESDLHRIVKESVKKILREADFDGHAYGYDQAYKTADSLEDLDAKLKANNDWTEKRGQQALDNHPGRIDPLGSVGSFMYTHPKSYGFDSEEELLAGLEDRADRGRDLAGFPY